MQNKTDFSVDIIIFKSVPTSTVYHWWIIPQWRCQ